MQVLRGDNSALANDIRKEMKVRCSNYDSCQLTYSTPDKRDCIDGNHFKVAKRLIFSMLEIGLIQYLGV